VNLIVLIVWINQADEETGPGSEPILTTQIRGIRMMELMQAFMSEVEKQPLWVQIWLNILGAVNIAAVFFIFKSRLAWIVAGAIALSFFGIMYLYSEFGYVRLLGLPHIVFWTPMLLYFWKIVPGLEPSLLKKYLFLVMGINFISLLFDYVDVARYFLGSA
jgi:hypothetical protein